MTSSSFKESRIRPESYRTPSPPNPAIELLTPLATDHVVALGVPALDRGGISISQEETRNTNNNSHVSNRNDQDTMNAFALIALATSPPAPHHSATHALRKRSAQAAMGDQHLPEAHVAKRAKSELLRSPEWRRHPAGNDPRPATSYDTQVQSSTTDAELLLNFSQIARSTYDSRKTHRHTQSDQLYLSSPTSITTMGNVVGHHSAQKVRCDSPSNINRQAHWAHTTTQSKGVDQSPDDSRVQSEPRLPHSLDSRSPKTADYPFHTNNTTAVPKSNSLASHKNPPQTSDFTRVGCSPSRQVPGFATATDAANGLISERTHDDGKTARLQASEETWTETKSLHTSYTFTSSSSGLKVDANGDGECENADGMATRAPASTSSAINVGESILSQKAIPGSICAACKFSRNSSSMDSEYNATSWISCDACKSWFHFACAGFRNEREVRSVDKFRCKACKPMHGATTFVRKSSRAHTAIDYAGLNEGVVKTSDERPEHHYIKPIKDGTITFLPETFARMPPELVTADFFERNHGMKEPIVIPAALNPRPHSLDASLQSSEFDKPMDPNDDPANDQSAGGGSPFGDCEYEAVPEQEQDALDMIMPRDLTVRQVAELYGPEEKVEVIDVKSQNGESKKWNMRRWADYYESSGSKIVRNVISLEVSRSRLGRLIRRPQVVRDLDLQDSVWPAELQARGEIPRVQFYCLMSVADCFTDFHIDFGGSSVFYHILRGRKTFLFIPPKEKHLKKYEEWCMSPAQNWTFLADQTKECYRVDLLPGDTMLIPAGWIHAVWTPEDSLVIGGNFLTRMNYGMQFRVAQLEKATGVARKFRYPHFQKLHWFAALKYLEEDPLPASVKDLLQDGGTYHRERPAHYDFNEKGGECMQGTEDFHARYYSQSELEGLPELLRYLLRTAMIDNGMIVEGITQETRNAVKRSIPRGHGEPLEIVKLFALWCAWKRGNEEIPPWAHLDAVPDVPETSGKLSAATQRRMEREATLQGPRRQSARQQSQRQVATPERGMSDSINGEQVHMGAEGMTNDPRAPPARSVGPFPQHELMLGANRAEHPDEEPTAKALQTTSELSPNPRRKVACETCRQRRRACKHKTTGTVLKQGSDGVLVPSEALDAAPQPDSKPQVPKIDVLGPTIGRDSSMQIRIDHKESPATTWKSPARSVAEPPTMPYPEASDSSAHDHITNASADAEHPGEFSTTVTAKTTSPTTNSSQNRGRNNKACADCRKSKRRCIHDELGNEDPVKVNRAENSRPRTLLKTKYHEEAQRYKMEKEKKAAEENEDRLRKLDGDDMVHAEGVLTDSTLGVQNSSNALSGSAPGSSATRLLNIMPEKPDERHRTLLPEERKRASQPIRRKTLSPTTGRVPEIARLPRSGHIDNGEDQLPAQHHGTSPPSGTGNEGTSVLVAREDLSPDAVPTNTTVQARSQLKVETDFSSTAALASNELDSRAAAKSLASPPPSSNSPSITTGAASTGTSSRHSSHPAKAIERYSPSSDSARRTSTSSEGIMHRSKRAASRSSSPLTSVASDEDTEKEKEKAEMNPSPSSKQRTPMTPKMKKDPMSGWEGTDDKTMQLIQELQAQEHGLRKRGRA